MLTNDDGTCGHFSYSGISKICYRKKYMKYSCHFFKFKENNLNIIKLQIFLPPASYPSQLFWCDLQSFGGDCLLLNIMEFSGTRLVVFKMPKMSEDG